MSPTRVRYIRGKAFTVETPLESQATSGLSRLQEGGPDILAPSLVKNTPGIFYRHIITPYPRLAGVHVVVSMEHLLGSVSYTHLTLPTIYSV